MKGKLMLYLAWLIVIAAIIAFHIGNERESTSFYGIAETREISVNFEKGVEIKKIHVVPGQTIAKNELIVELRQPELELKINEISHQLEELKAKKPEQENAIKSQINQIEAQIASTTSDINYKIKQVETQQDINKELTGKLDSFKDNSGKNKTKSNKNPMSLQIESLQKELEMSKNLMRIKINLLKDELGSSMNAVLVRMESLTRELTLLNEEKQKLFIYSQIAGIIGSVNCKEGEKAPPFSSILTLHTKSPSYVVGYINENIYNKAAVGDRLEIVSMTGNGASVPGEIVGIGSRIVEYPIRLRKRPEISLWGREVQIKIPQDNDFLLGEKVMINPLKNNGLRWNTLLTRILGKKEQRE